MADVWVTYDSDAFEAGTSGAFMISRSETVGPLTVGYSMSGTAVPGADYSTPSGNVTFQDGESDVWVPIDPIDNLLDEPDRSVVLTLANEPDPYNIVAPGYDTLTIFDDDDPPTISISDATPVMEGDSGITTATFTVSLSAPSGYDVTAGFETTPGTADGTDFDANATGQVVIPAGQTSAPLTVDVYGDTVFEPDEMFSVDLTGADHATLGATSAVGTIVNDDPAPEIDVLDPDGNSLPSGGTVDFGETEAGMPVMLMFTIQNTGGGDLALSPGSISVPDGFSVQLPFNDTVAPGDWTALSIQLDASQTGTFDGNVSFTSNDEDEGTYTFTVSGAVVDPTPDITVLDDLGQPIDSGLGEVDFGTTTIGTPIQRTITILNGGYGELTLDPQSLVVPDGFSIVTPFASTVDPFYSTELVIQMDADADMSYGGDLSFATNDANVEVFSVFLTGSATPLPNLWLDLDQDYTSDPGAADYLAEWDPGGGPVRVENQDNAAVMGNSSTLDEMMVWLPIEFDPGYEWLSANTSGTSITATYDVNYGVLTLSGVDSVSNYQQVLRTITYDNTAVDPQGVDREIHFQAFDGSVVGETAVSFVSILSDADVTSVVFVPASQLPGNGDSAHYGELQPGKNPDGSLTDPENKSHGALIEPAFMGGDRFFPDADVATPTVGRNVVRVRAFVTGMNLDDPVYFKSFDVDDPSSDEAIDPKQNGDRGGDNRGILNLSDVNQPGPSHAAGHKPVNGKLRPVNKDEALGAWGGDGAIVTAKVKDIVMASGETKRVAEVDLLTTFAPGDNFRVFAVPEQRKAGLDLLQTDKPGEKYFVQTAEPFHRLTPQLSVWRYLHVEDDSSVDVYGMMAATGAAGVNRQTNRFADAYLEPEYVQLNAPTFNTSSPAGGFRLRLDGSLSVIAPQTAQIDAARQSDAVENPTYWAVYITDAFAQPARAVWGVTQNKDGGSSFDFSVVHNANLQTFLLANGVSAEEVAQAQQMVTVHEVGHQILAPGGPGSLRPTRTESGSGHRGTLANISAYWLASDEVKAQDDRWVPTINVMNTNAFNVPDGVREATPNGGNVGDIDRFYFHPLDIAKMRGLSKSPGK